MERILSHNPDELLKQGRTLLTTQQKVHTKNGSWDYVSKDLVVGNPNQVRLSSSEIHYIQYESRRIDSGRGLEKSIIYKTKTGQTVLIFDTDHLHYPYLGFLITKGVIKKPINFVHIDAHIDLGDIRQEPPEPLLPFCTVNQREMLRYFRDHVEDYNFVTALAAAKYIRSVAYLSHTPMVDIFSGTNYCWVESRYKLPITSVHPFRQSRYFTLFGNITNNLLAIDLDFFGSPLNVPTDDGLNPVTRAKKLCDYLIYAGYNPKRVPVVCMATSPGYKDGYEAEEEKLEVLEIIIKRLNLQPPNKTIKL